MIYIKNGKHHRNLDITLRVSIKSLGPMSHFEALINIFIRTIYTIQLSGHLDWTIRRPSVETQLQGSSSKVSYFYLSEIGIKK